MQMPSSRTHPQARLGLTPANSWISLPSLTLGVATNGLPQDKDSQRVNKRIQPSTRLESQSQL